MSYSADQVQRRAESRQRVIRITSVVFLLCSVVVFALAALLYSGMMGLTDPELLPFAQAGIAFTLVQGVYLLLLAIFGFRAAHNRFKVKLYCALTLVFTALLIANEVLSGYPTLFGVLLGDAVSVAQLVIFVLAFVSTGCAFALVSHNRRHPREEPAQPAPEPVSAVPPAGPDRAAMAGVPLELRLSSKILSIKNKIDVLDAHDNVVYRVHNKLVALNDRTYIEDSTGRQVATLHAKLVSVHNRYFVEMSNGREFELSREVMHINDYINIDALGWQLRSQNFLEFNFDIFDERERVVASARRKLISLHDTYMVDVYDLDHIDEVVAIFVVMKHIMERREASAADSVLDSD